MSTPHWFEPVADHLGPAYLRYSFTMGTGQEVEFLSEVLDLGPGSRLLDVGCGPGRHAAAFGRRGVEVVGVDISQRFVEVARDAAPPGVTYLVADAREMGFEAEFDAVISLCQGAFGLCGGPAAGWAEPGGSSPLDPDLPVLSAMCRALRPGGLAAFTAFSAYFQVRFLEPTDRFDASAGVNLERSLVRSESGEEVEVELWTSCFTPRELRLMCDAVGLGVRHIWSVTPGGYEQREPDIDHPELLVIAERLR